MASTGEAWRLGRRPVVIALVAALALALAAATTVVIRTQPDVEDPYLWFAETNVDQLPIVAMTDGIPLVRYPGIAAPQENPVTVAQWGLSHYSRGDTATALRAADWLLEHQEADGTWRYHFDFYVLSGDATMRAPWISGLAQGQTLSLLVRAWKATADEKYLDAARAAIAPFSIPVADGGVLRVWHGHPFYEEYPTPQPSLVLNGFLFQLIGLHDLADATGDVEAQRLWEQGEETAAALIEDYSLGGAESSYALSFRDGGTAAVPVRGSVYDTVHRDLPMAMYELTGRPVYKAMSQRWAGAVPRSPAERLGGPAALLVTGVAALVLLLRRWRRSVGTVEGLQQQPDEGVVLPGKCLGLGGELRVGGRGDREEVPVRR